jgi:DNA-binding NarL/FixJ family response regulator
MLQLFARGANQLDSSRQESASLRQSSFADKDLTYFALCGRNRLLMEALGNRLIQEPAFACCGMVENDAHLTSPQLLSVPDLIVCELPTSSDLTQIQRMAPAAVLVAVVTDDDNANHDGESLPNRWPWQVSTRDSLSHFLDVIRAAVSSSAAFSSAAEVSDGDTDPSPIATEAVSAEERLAVLNPRELEVFTLLAQGRSVKEVANALGSSFKAIDSQKYRIMRKLGLTDRVQATRLAIRAGVINP